MKISLFLGIIVTVLSCSKATSFDPSKYYPLINQAELLICDEAFADAVSTYEKAFKEISKPFGKDLFNAALASKLAGFNEKRNIFLQQIINNSDDLDHVTSILVDTYISKEEWKTLLEKRTVDYDIDLRKEAYEMVDRDQLFRPMYETHDDTINANRIINMNRILELTDERGLPSQYELGFANRLVGPIYKVVFHHNAQRRSSDKSVVDLESILFKAVNEGKFDPELAIYYLNFQNDLEKGKFEVYPTTNFSHPLLPDSLNNKVWGPKLSQEQKELANQKRVEWHANSLEEIEIKTKFISKNEWPFKFTSVRHSNFKISLQFDHQTALEQYYAFSSMMQAAN